MNVALRFVTGPGLIGTANPAYPGEDEKYPEASIVKLPGTGLAALELVFAQPIVTPMAERMGIVCLPRLFQPTENSKERD
ncbi:MAG: hypothetical protein ABJN75_00990 [Hoeflea sp.]|uniref:hypothetical protein n=1 Tax=Hoeflea sp. TaxID=1940281 RepID=UPI0032984F46|tara:strand:- start:199 stop:438 length:240 start_codon:yes stop_codon:yes gene_type:complete